MFLFNNHFNGLKLCGFWCQNCKLAWRRIIYYNVKYNVTNIEIALYLFYDNYSFVWGYMTIIWNADAVKLSSVMIFIYRFKDLQIYGAQTHDHRFKPSSNFQILISWHNHKMAKCRQNNVIRKRINFLGSYINTKYTWSIHRSINTIRNYAWIVLWDEIKRSNLFVIAVIS